jgi:twitching motility two-component system response regulator PilH
MGTKKVLIVDDEQDVLVYFSTLFEDHGFEAITAENGVIAIKFAKSESPDLITLDITMPEQSGILTYRYLKQDPDLRHIPIIFITAIGESISDVIHQLSDFPEEKICLSKPIDIQELIDTASKLTSSDT